MSWTTLKTGPCQTNHGFYVALYFFKNLNRVWDPGERGPGLKSARKRRRTEVSTEEPESSVLHLSSFSLHFRLVRGHISGNLSFFTIFPLHYFRIVPSYFSKVPVLVTSFPLYFRTRPAHFRKISVLMFTALQVSLWVFRQLCPQRLFNLSSLPLSYIHVSKLRYVMV